MSIGAWVSLAAAFACVAIGRIVTIDLTEGRAFVAGWPFWVCAVVWMMIFYRCTMAK